MAHYAQINEFNEVVQVLVVPDYEEHRATEFLCDDLGLSGVWLKTSYNTHGGQHSENGTPLRKNFAGIGYKYDAKHDAFIPPKPYPSWLLDSKTFLWKSPVPYPENENAYVWDEAQKNWVQA